MKCIEQAELKIPTFRVLPAGFAWLHNICYDVVAHVFSRCCCVDFPLTYVEVFEIAQLGPSKSGPANASKSAKCSSAEWALFAVKVLSKTGDA